MKTCGKQLATSQSGETQPKTDCNNAFKILAESGRYVIASTSLKESRFCTIRCILHLLTLKSYNINTNAFPFSKHFIHLNDPN